MEQRAFVVLTPPIALSRCLSYHCNIPTSVRHMGGEGREDGGTHTSEIPSRIVHPLVNALSFFFFFFYKLSSDGWVKVKLNKLPHLARIRYMSCFDLTHAPVATTARAAATGPVSMSTRPDPEGSDTVEIATRKCPRLRVVWDLRELTH